ncbi:hypothetical protein ACIQZI_13535 [Peribacillus sp. NPDC096379]|uniref:hypothetical protein n=1 Tax=Peribacillus sp. NPDC096379 TaxID=3364393 RepID=UPI0037F623E6
MKRAFMFYILFPIKLFFICRLLDPEVLDQNPFSCSFVHRQDPSYFGSLVQIGQQVYFPFSMKIFEKQGRGYQLIQDDICVQLFG